MMKTQNINRPIKLAVAITWLVMFITPVLSSATMTNDWSRVTDSLLRSLKTIGPGCVLFFLNFLVLIPRFLFGSRKQKVVFFAVNAALIALIVWGTYPKPPQLPEDVISQIPRRALRSARFFRSFTAVCVNVFILVIAIGIKSFMRSNELVVKYEQERRNAAEAELSWLKNQLNPHFLFNTLNNISSLTQIDADKAQDSIGQLSDLLRYALYDSENQTVPIEGEIEFMQNYVNLMSLRCSDNTTVECDLSGVHGNIQIAPLLFISLIENAFKHGVNARKESVVKISLGQDGHDLVFNCQNTLFPKPESEHIGSGIGLENMKRRLDIIYPGAYEYDKKEENGLYKATVRLKGLVR